MAVFMRLGKQAAPTPASERRQDERLSPQFREIPEYLFDLISSLVGHISNLLGALAEKTLSLVHELSCAVCNHPLPDPTVFR